MLDPTQLGDEMERRVTGSAPATLTNNMWGCDLGFCDRWSIVVCGAVTSWTANADTAQYASGNRILCNTLREVVGKKEQHFNNN